MSQTLQNIGLLAHVDAGKTSITENLLFLTQQTKQLGSVDKGTSVTDSMQVEKDRGISVQAAQTSIMLDNHKINLIDTPGHVDFSAELERSIRIMDGAVIILSAVEGVQAHTFSIWNALKTMQIPCLFFINKNDRAGADTDSITQQLEKEFGIQTLTFHEVINEGSDNANIQSLWNETFQSDENIETLAGADDELLSTFLDGKIPDFDVLQEKLKIAVQKRKIFPVLCGTAKYSLGIEDLFSAIQSYLPKANHKNTEKAAGGVIFKVTHHQQHGRIAHTRLYQGKLNIRDKIIHNGNVQKINQLFQKVGATEQTVKHFSCGDIAGICGLQDAISGDIIGETTTNMPDALRMHSPLLTVQTKAINDKDYPALANALTELSAEDPALEFEWLKDEQELHIKIMGWIQIQILESVLESRFGIAASFENPTVIYKETPASLGEGFVRYWMPKPCWAILKFKIEPLPQGSGVVYESAISVDDVHRKYQNEVERTIPQALKQGIKGWEVTDIKITLIEGEDHPVHSRPGDFIVATPMGIMEGLQQIGTTFLEPILDFRISADESLLGNIAGDITQMRGSFDAPEIENGKIILKGKFPLASSLDYPVKLASRSGGKASIHTNLSHYQACDENLGEIRSYRGISPLDTAKYILKARKALQ
ncbi:MAG: TetM/TetW/TetO/TetS family tetracycline resistance ribosomal protection protein [Bacteroidales bacterium]|jgi:ribosomal protection tetracycline resistance protein|nr:TetM/TetW/TetO/TetS family tetracycline resistance ribosomal protection protein [Bacteroidales bacterium]